MSDDNFVAVCSIHWKFTKKIKKVIFGSDKNLQNHFTHSYRDLFFYFSISAFYCVCLPWPSNYFQQLFNVVGGIFPLHLALSRFNCENSRVKCNEKNSCFMLKTFLLLINYFIDFVLKSLAYKFHEIIQMTIKCHQNSLVTWLSLISTSEVTVLALFYVITERDKKRVVGETCIRIHCDIRP